MIKVLITGARGQLGSEFRFLSNSFPEIALIFTDVDDLNILDKDKMDRFLRLEQPDYIVNCAAYTNVDKAEDDGLAAYSLNALAVRNIASIAKTLNIGVIQISTDYVFSGDGDEPYSESDLPQPISVYGLTKYFGEYELCEIGPPNSIIIRTSWMYSSYGNNFVKTIQKLSNEKSEISVVNDQIGSPTYARDLARAILKILPYKSENDVEIVNFANRGSCSWYTFAKEIVDLSENECDITPVSSNEFRTKAKRPKYSILNTDKFERMFQIEMRPWKDSLKICMLERSNN